MVQALKVLLGFRVRVVQTFEPPGTYEHMVYQHRSVPVRYRPHVALKVLQNNSEVDWLAGLYAMQVLISEDDRRALLEEWNGVA